jgi:hypothetical protein
MAAGDTPSDERRPCRHGNATTHNTYSSRILCLDCGAAFATADEWQRASNRAAFAVPPPRKCAKCRERRVVVVVQPYTTNAERDGRSYTVSIPDLAVLRCENCGNVVLPDAADDRIAEALRVAMAVPTLPPSAVFEEHLIEGENEGFLKRLLGG